MVVVGSYDCVFEGNVDCINKNNIMKFGKSRFFCVYLIYISVNNILVNYDEVIINYLLYF